MRQLLPIALLALAACSSEANHVGNPLTLPVRGVAAGIENANYDARRNHLKTYLVSNRAVIISQIRSNGGSHLAEAMERARVPAAKRSTLVRELNRDPNLYFGNDIEPMVVAFMVHGDN